MGLRGVEFEVKVLGGGRGGGRVLEGLIVKG